MSGSSDLLRTMGGPALAVGAGELPEGEFSVEGDEFSACSGLM
ncbi:MAG: hypothetical protein QM784_25440 [Polyangiaceae bacterium]